MVAHWASVKIVRIKVAFHVANLESVSDRFGNPQTSTRHGKPGAIHLSKVKVRPKHHGAMGWQDVPAFDADLTTPNAMAAKALMFTCLSGSRTGEVLGMQWPEVDFDAGLWTCPAEWMKGGVLHRVPLTTEMRAILEPLRAMESDYVFEGRDERNRALGHAGGSNTSSVLP